jgi:polyisoprenoid-binding protein YceI
MRMTSIAAQPFSGTYRVQAAVSTFAFAVRHSGVFWYRGSLSDVTGTLHGDGDGEALTLEGSARVDSISVLEPAAMRASVLGPEFFDTEGHPEITFHSAAIRLADDGSAEVDGELTIRGITRPVTASGTYAPPRATSFGEVAGLELHTSIDRREFGFKWQAALGGRGRHGQLDRRGRHRSAAHPRTPRCWTVRKPFASAIRFLHHPKVISTQGATTNVDSPSNQQQIDAQTVV